MFSNEMLIVTDLDTEVVKTPMEAYFKEEMKEDRSFAWNTVGMAISFRTKRNYVCGNTLSY